MIIFDEGNKNDITFTSVYGFFVEPRYKRQPGLRRRRRRRGGGGGGGGGAVLHPKIPG